MSYDDHHFFWKCLKFDVNSRNGTENWENVFLFYRWLHLNWEWQTSQSWTGYLPSAVNVLTNSPKLSPNFRGDVFQINFPENDEKNMIKVLSWRFCKYLDAFTCSLSKCCLKPCFLENVRTKFFTVCNFGNTLAMTIIFSFKMCKTLYRLRKWIKKLRKGFSLFR